MASGDTNDVNYWRGKAEEYKRLWEEEKEEFREFQQNSKELETELETQLELVEKNNAELQAKVERLSIQVETSNDKHDILVGKLNRQVTNLQEEVNTLKAEVFQQKQYIRQLEQVNDDLERSNRNALASVEDTEDRLNQVLEKNALLEVELYEKDELNVRVQRLKDEVRDLNQELNHRSRVQVSPEKAIPPQVTVEQTTRDTSEACMQTEGGRTPSLATTLRPLTPSTRIAALNLVGDLLQKIAQLEANFANVCRYASNLSGQRRCLVGEYLDLPSPLLNVIPCPHVYVAPNRCQGWIVLFQPSHLQPHILAPILRSKLVIIHTHEAF
uniref:Nuclear distribution protein nude 1 n=1 Tax=Echinococcus granulosus TaxID=6210 RepID=A0A068WMX3_ECHGR|nr:nuclear distribution protein nude 1 [Echinococcus granulosus]